MIASRTFGRLLNTSTVVASLATFIWYSEALAVRCSCCPMWLSSELMSFAGLFAMFFTVKAQHDGPWPPENVVTGEPIHLDIPYALVITIVLVASSFTCQWGVFKAEQGDVFGLRLWYSITFL